jgi:hypothetical protein
MSEYSDLGDLVTFRPLERASSQSGGRLSPFRAGWSDTVGLLADELRHHGARQVVLEVDIREKDIRVDGLPRANAIAQSPIVILSFTATQIPGKPQLRYEVGTFTDWRDNIRGIALGLRALRAVDRYGVTKRGEQYAGWKQLASGSASPSADRGREIIAQHGGLKLALKATHPDHGGSAIDFADVQAAKDAGVA